MSATIQCDRCNQQIAPGDQQRSPKITPKNQPAIWLEWDDAFDFCQSCVKAIVLETADKIRSEAEAKDKTGTTAKAKERVPPDCASPDCGMPAYGNGVLCIGCMGPG